jgi:plastocyanin
MNSRITVTIAGALLAATTLVGCGSNGSNSSSYSSPTAPSATVPPTSTPSTPTPPTTTPNPAPTPTPAPTVADVVITITGMNGAQSFSPSPATVVVGQTVSWVNKDSVVHTATGDAGGFDTGFIAPGATSAPITMGAAGSFGYHCAVHPSMTGSLTVVASSQGPY